MADLIIGVIIAAAVAAVIVKIVKNKKEGKTCCGCSGGCDCASKGKCH